MKKNKIYLILLWLCLSLNVAAKDFLWSKAYGGGMTDYIHEMITDNDNNIYIVGGFYNSIYIDEDWYTTPNYLDAYVIKLNPGGELEWFRNFGGPIWDMSIDIKFDNAGEHFYVTGFFEAYINFDDIELVSNGTLDMYIAKFDLDGNVIWAKNGGGNWHDYGYCISIDDNDNVYISGKYESVSFDFDGNIITNSGGTDIFILKINSNGEYVWLEKAGGASYDEPVDMLIKSESLILTGNFSLNANFGNHQVSGYHDDLFVARYDLDGGIYWVSAAHSEGGISPQALAHDIEGNYYICGHITDNAHFDDITLKLIGQEDIFVTKINFLGDFEWAKNYGGTDFNTAYDIAVSENNKVYLTGSLVGTLYFPGYELISNGFSDAYFAELNNSGELKWVFQLGNDDSQYGDDGRVIFENNQGKLMIGGRFSRDITIDNNYYDAFGSRDVFIAQLDQLSGNNNNNNNNVFKISPNPLSGNKIEIQSTDDSTPYYLALFDINGNRIKESKSIQNKQTKVDVSELTPGIYLIRIESKDRIYTEKLIKL